MTTIINIEKTQKIGDSRSDINDNFDALNTGKEEVGVAATDVATHSALTTGVHGVGAGTVAKTSDITATKLDDFATPDNNTDLNANTTNHGLLLQATAPAAGLLNVVGIANGETAYTNKALFDATVPSTQAFGDAAAVGSAVASARRDHKHAIPANPVTAQSIGFTIAAGTTSKTLTVPLDATVSGSNTGDQTLPVKATGAEINNGTDDAKFATAKAIADSSLRSFSSFTNPYKFRVSRNAAANSGNGAFATIAFDTEQYDTGNNVSAGVFTAPVSGYYQFNWRSGATTSGLETFIASLFVDNAEYSRGVMQGINTASSSSVGSDCVYVASGKTVDVRTYCNAARALYVADTIQTCFSGFLVSIT
jgi:hypothetical protein